MSVAAKTGNKAVWVANSVVNTTVLIVILLLLVFSCYALWDSSQVYAAAEAKQYEKYKPTTEGGGLSFQELQTINPEVCAWLTVYGTHIDYPVVQGLDNLKYVNTNAEGKHSLSGAVFLDCDNAKNFSDFASFLYGHHMEKEKMFGEIGLFAHKDYFDVRNFGSLYYEGKEHGLEFFAFVHADAYDDKVFRTQFGSFDERQAYLDLMLRCALNVRTEVRATPEDRLVLLSTCSAGSTNGRDLLIGRITDETYPNLFAQRESKTQSPAIRRLVNFWEKTPLWLRIILVALPLFLILLMIATAHTKKQYAREESAALTIEGKL